MRLRTRSSGSFRSATATLRHAKTLMLFGGVLWVVSAYLLFVPIGVDPVAVSRGEAEANVSVYYYATLYILYFFAITLFRLPHVSWGWRNR